MANISVHQKIQFCVCVLLSLLVVACNKSVVSENIENLIPVKNLDLSETTPLHGSYSFDMGGNCCQYTMFFYDDGRVLMRVMIFGDELLGSSKDEEYVIYLDKYQPIMQGNDSLSKYFAVTQDGMLHLLTDDKKYISNSCSPLISYNQSNTCSIPLKPDN